VRLAVAGEPLNAEDPPERVFGVFVPLSTMGETGSKVEDRMWA
jgi:hypothetical protein